MLHVVLFEPEIPQNTGNIVRTCAATGVALHLIYPLGFSLNEKRLKRAGLDYWQEAAIYEHSSWHAFQKTYPQANCYYLSTKGKHLYTDINFKPGDFLVFGPETRGLPAFVMEAAKGHILKVPMRPGMRSLNLANTAALVLYEALRQLDFPGMEA